MTRATAARNAVRRVGRVGVTAAVVAMSVLAVNGEAAQAKPSRCTYDYGPGGGWANCRTGTGEFRVWVRCMGSDGSSILFEDVTGPWRAPGEGVLSTVSCPSGHSGINGGFNLADWT